VDGGVRGQFRDGPRALTGREIASMKLLGVSGDDLRAAGGEFDAFLRRSAPAGRRVDAAEAIGALVAAGRADVPSRGAGPWFGLTHATIGRSSAGLVDLVANGVYPNPLWTAAAT